MLPAPRKETIVRSFFRVRPLGRAEAGAAVDAVFAGMSARSRFQRFHSPVPRLPATLRDRLVDLDGLRRVAVVAEAAGAAPIGIARLVATAPGEAEMAVAVVDAWQRRGVGVRLLDALTGVARDLGYRRLTGTVLPGNVAMLALAARVAPGSRRSWDGETVRLVVPLAAPADAWEITEDDVLAELLAR